MDLQGAGGLPALHFTLPGSTKACRVGKAKCWWLLGNFKPSYKYNLHKSIKFQIVKRGESIIQLQEAFSLQIKEFIAYTQSGSQ